MCVLGPGSHRIKKPKAVLTFLWLFNSSSSLHVSDDSLQNLATSPSSLTGDAALGGFGSVVFSSSSKIKPCSCLVSVDKAACVPVLLHQISTALIFTCVFSARL